jgi:hypothetical protein
MRIVKHRSSAELGALVAVSLDRIRALIEISYGCTVTLPKSDVEPRPPVTCKNCGGLLKLRAVLRPLRVLLWSG